LKPLPETPPQTWRVKQGAKHNSYGKASGWESLLLLAQIKNQMVPAIKMKKAQVSP
jgi:hypothetical protein